jgi:hypothetical protein
VVVVHHAATSFRLSSSFRGELSPEGVEVGASAGSCIKPEQHLFLSNGSDSGGQIWSNGIEPMLLQNMQDGLLKGIRASRR